MAERRMFAKTIIMSDAFLDMPPTTRCLYISLGMVADDDGIVNSPKSIMRQSGASIDDIQILIAKKFIIPFDSGVIAIKHWKINNYIQKDRYSQTKYIDELEKLNVDSNNAYTYKENEQCIQDVYKMDTQVRLGKDRLGKDRLVESKGTRFTPPTLEELKNEIKEKNYNVDAERFMNYYTSNGWKVGKNSMKSWKAALANWNKNEKKPEQTAQSYDSEKYKEKARQPIEYKRRETVSV